MNEEQDREEIEGTEPGTKTGEYGWVVFFLIVGLFFLGMGGFGWVRSESMKTWPTVTAKVVSSEVDTYRDTSLSTKVIPAETKYTPNIFCDYTFEGKIFQKVRLGNVPSGSSRSRAERIVAQYTPGSEIEIFIHPKEPSDIVLLRETAYFPRIFVALGSIVFLIGLAGVQETIKERKASRAGEA